MESADRDGIVSTLLDLRKLLARSQNEFASMSEEDLAALHERLEEHVDRLGGLVPGATPPSRLEDFFAQVGEGMVAAQAELDRQSIAYNEGRPPGALPSAYRIPKVQAEIGFTMSRKRSKGFGVFALGRSASGEKRHNNSVSFEVVSVPPLPTDTAAGFRGARLAGDPVERERAGTALKAARHESAVAASTAAVMLADFDRVIVVTFGGRWLLAHVVLVDGDVPATIQFGVLQVDPARFSSHGPIPASQADQSRWVQLRHFLNELAAAQATALRRD